MSSLELSGLVIHQLKLLLLLNASNQYWHKANRSASWSWEFPPRVILPNKRGSRCSTKVPLRRRIIKYCLLRLYFLMNSSSMFGQRNSPVGGIWMLLLEMISVWVGKLARSSCAYHLAASIRPEIRKMIPKMKAAGSSPLENPPSPMAISNPGP